MVHEFDLIPISDEKKPRVGIVGEILVKFLPAANNHLAELLEAEGAEAVVPGSDRLYAITVSTTRTSNVNSLDLRKIKQRSQTVGIKAIEWLRKTGERSTCTEPSLYTGCQIFADLAKMASTDRISG